MENIIKKSVTYLKAKGLKSFILLVNEKEAKQLRYIYEEISPREALLLSLGLLEKTINLDIDRHPNYSKEHVEILKTLLTDVTGCFKKCGDSFIKLQKKNKK